MTCWKASVTNPSGKKGTAWETAVRRFLEGSGLPAKRKQKEGRFDKGDIELADPLLADILIEAKNQKALKLAEWVDEAIEEAANAGARIGALWHHRVRRDSPGGGYVTMRGDHFAALLHELRKARGDLEAAHRHTGILEEYLSIRTTEAEEVLSAGEAQGSEPVRQAESG
jgi:hypothetical protein